MSYDLAGLGNALVDALVVVEDDSVLSELHLDRGTTHMVDHDEWERAYDTVRELKITFDSGGSCANTIATAGRLGCRALYCGQVGDDQMGKLYASLMEKATGSHALRFSPSAATGKCLSIISKADAERTMVTDLGAAVGLSELGDFDRALTSTKIAHFTGYTLLPGPAEPVVVAAMRQARAAGAMVSLDAADPFVIDLVKDRIWQVLENHTDLVFLNEEEARHLTGQAAEEALDTIADRTGMATVVVKIGKRGSLVRHHGERYRVEANVVKAVDTTGAGDAYAGGFITGLARGWDIPHCGRLASNVAALTVAQVGATVKDPDLLAKALRDARPQA